MRIGASLLRHPRQSDSLEKFQRENPSLVTRNIPVTDELLGDLRADPLDGIEADFGLLEDHCNAFATDVFHLRFGQADELSSRQTDAAGHNLARSRQQSHDAQCSHALATSTLANHAKYFAAPHTQVKRVDGSQ